MQFLPIPVMEDLPLVLQLLDLPFNTLVVVVVVAFLLFM
jgi:hypothetical protein